jgi:hypothetical protein
VKEQALGGPPGLDRAGALAGEVLEAGHVAVDVRQLAQQLCA